MIVAGNPGADLPGDDEDVEDEATGGDRCAVCDKPEGECDHLVASIDLAYSEFTAGAIFADQRALLDLAEHLVASDPDVLKAVGAGPALEYVATLVKAEMEEGASVGDAVSVHYPQLVAAMSHMLQEDDEVSATTAEAATGDDSSVENLWAKDPEQVVNSLMERFQFLADEIDAA